ncbi:MAG: DUF3372 domain-containing protein, partial [Caldilineaceae bacterium]|nr:DUF3372 domain-containing protein [Caldilineaceae bacterium]
NWGVGLPPESSANESDLVALLGNPDLAPTSAEIQAANAHARDMLAIRASSPLFRLRTADEIQDRLAFHNTGPDQVPGVIVMSISDRLDGATAAGQASVGATAMEDLDPERELVVVVFNANDEAQTVTVPGYAGVDIELHGYQIQGSDEVVRDARFDMNTGSFTVPARTTAVFVELVTPTAEQTGTEPAAPRLRNPIFLPLIVR